MKSIDKAILLKRTTVFFMLFTLIFRIFFNFELIFPLTLLFIFWSMFTLEVFVFSPKSTLKRFLRIGIVTGVNLLLFLIVMILNLDIDGCRLILSTTNLCSPVRQILAFIIFADLVSIVPFSMIIWIRLIIGYFKN